MKEEEILLNADYAKEKFKIEIIVCQNGNKCQVSKITEKATYQEIIGALETCKVNYILAQSAKNRESAINEKDNER